MLQASITAEDRGRIIFRAFAPEDRSIKGKAEYRVSRAGGRTVFAISAADSTSLRTAMNSITRMLTVIEKMRGIK